MKYLLKLTLLSLIIAYDTFGNVNPDDNRESFLELKYNHGGIIFSVDPRIELFQAVILGTGLPMINYVDIEYKSKVDKFISKHRDHSLFTFARRNLRFGKVFTAIDAPMWFLLHLTTDFNWRNDVIYFDKQNVNVDSFRYHMNKFIKETDYINFFNSNADFYNISLKALMFNLGDFEEKERVLNYYGAKDKEKIHFNLILNFFGWGNFGPRLQTKNGKELYAVISPEKSFMRLPTFNQVSLYKLIWHEFGHSFANPAVEKQPYLSQIEALSHLLGPIKESMQSQAYSGWSTVLKEHLTEAVACRLAAQKFGEDYAELNFVRHQKGKYWIYLNPLLEVLKEYEHNRSKYPTLDDFMPQIVNALRTVKTSDTDKWTAETEEIRKPDIEKIPSIDEIFQKDSVLVILSSSEKDKVGDEKLKAFVKEFITNTSLAKATIVSDVKAKGMNLSKYNLFIVGTPNGNSVIAEMLPYLPIKLTEEGILGEKRYEGKGYALLAGWINPYNVSKVMTIITGLQAGDLLNFNYTPYGGTNYHIMKDLITYKTGDFKRTGMVWICD